MGKPGSKKQSGSTPTPRVDPAVSPSVSSGISGNGPPSPTIQGISRRRRIVVAGTLSIVIAASFALVIASYRDFVFAMSNQYWCLLGVVAVTLGVSCYLLLEEAKPSELIKPVLGAVVLSVVPALYAHSRDLAAQRANTREQLVKIGTSLSAMRANLVTFASECSPAMHDATAPPEVTFRQFVTSNKCAERFDAIVSNWINATWIYRLQMPEISNRRVLNSDHDEAAAQTDEDTVLQTRARELLAVEGTDIASVHYRNFVNAYVDDPACLGHALSDFFHITRRFGCILMYAVNIERTAFETRSCRRYLASEMVLKEETTDVPTISETSELKLNDWWKGSGRCVRNDVNEFEAVFERDLCSVGG